MHESVEDGIGEGGVADDFMPLFDWQLRGDEGRTQAMSVVEDVEQVAALLGIECREPPVIEDEEVGFGELGEVLGIGAVAASDGDVGQKAWDAEVAGGEAIATGAVGDGTGEEGFADAGGPGDEDIEVVVDKAASGKLGEERFIKATASLAVEVLEGGLELEVSTPQPIGELSIATQRVFAFDEEGEPEATKPESNFTSRSWSRNPNR